MTVPPLLVYDPESIAGARITRQIANSENPYNVEVYTDFHVLAEAIENAPAHLALVAALTDDLPDELNRIRIVHEEFPALPVVLILPRGAWLKPTEIVRVGAIELLPSDVEDHDLDNALQRAARIGQAAVRLQVHETAKEPVPVISLLSPVGGAGRTFLATNLAHWMHKEGREKVCLVDLSGPYGASTTALRLRADFNVTQACRASDDPETLVEHLDDYMVRHGLDFDVMAAGEDPSEWVNLYPDSIGRLIQLLTQAYDAIIIDGPSGIDSNMIEIANRSTTVCAVGTLDVTSLRAMRLFVEQLTQLGITEEQLRVMINRTTSGLGIEVADAVTYLKAELCSWIPADDEVRRSMNLGRPILAFQAEHKVSEKLELAFRTLEEPDEVETDENDQFDDALNGRSTGSRRFLPKLAKLK